MKRRILFSGIMIFCIAVSTLSGAQTTATKITQTAVVHVAKNTNGSVKGVTVEWDHGQGWQVVMNKTAKQLARLDGQTVEIAGIDKAGVLTVKSYRVVPFDQNAVNRKGSRIQIHKQNKK